MLFGDPHRLQHFYDFGLLGVRRPLVLLLTQSFLEFRQGREEEIVCQVFVRISSSFALKAHFELITQQSLYHPVDFPRAPCGHS